MLLWLFVNYLLTASPSVCVMLSMRIDIRVFYEIVGDFFYEIVAICIQSANIRTIYMNMLWSGTER